MKQATMREARSRRMAAWVVALLLAGRFADAQAMAVARLNLMHHNWELGR